MKKDFGKTWSNEDIDTVIAAKYYIKYVSLIIYALRSL